MSMKPLSYNPSDVFVPSKVTGELAKFFIDDLAEPATREAEVIREILKKRAQRNEQITRTTAWATFSEVAASRED
ncbi:hypothetical protein [Tumebacillus permanentifrigoris]|uniref:Uncharacterized protein n=1 Tax=Tumebacillus permanentifrigoris TaxID=378543 RepID=A0A316DEN3_9BACL|nr:hypothetical protein [Tumebacillus permanentifrigoris]PWK16425.1 hypothetical protein C7459_101289 [Tumebacillus permanentifrigoris]